MLTNKNLSCYPGAITIPDRNLVIAASEEDARENKIRESIPIYEFGGNIDMYPTGIGQCRCRLSYPVLSIEQPCCCISIRVIGGGIIDALHSRRFFLQEVKDVYDRSAISTGIDRWCVGSIVDTDNIFTGRPHSNVQCYDYRHLSCRNDQCR